MNWSAEIPNQLVKAARLSTSGAATLGEPGESGCANPGLSGDILPSQIVGDPFGVKCSVERGDIELTGDTFFRFHSCNPPSYVQYIAF